MNTNKKPSASASATTSAAWPPASLLAVDEANPWSRTVAFDLHHVIVDWAGAFAAFVNDDRRATGRKPISPDQMCFYRMGTDPAVDLTQEEFDEYFVTFARLSRGGYGSLTPYPGIKEALEKIRAAGIKIQVFTWVPGAVDRKPGSAAGYGTGVAQSVTKDLIRKLGLPVDPDRDLRFMSPGEKAATMVEEHIPLLVEDNPETAVAAALGIAHASILVPEKYNEGLVCRNVLRLSNRAELADAVISFFAKLDEAGRLL